MQLLSVEDYLLWEACQEEKHEFVGGLVYARAGGKLVHAAISANVIGALGGQLRGKACRPYTSDSLLRVQYPTHTRFYYPDVTVACVPLPADAAFHDQPTVIVEVISETTRRTDELEKRDAYLSIPTLQVYLLLEQDRAAAVVWRRGTQGFAREVYEGLDAAIPLPEVEARLALAEAYESVRFT